MPATVIEVTPTEEQLPSEGGGLYSELDVPADYEVQLSKVEDYDKGPGRNGWIFNYTCETPSGGSVDFPVYLNFSEASRWKILQHFAAHGMTITTDKLSLDPNALSNDKIGAFIDFPREQGTGEPTSQYREIQKVYALADESLIEAGTPSPVELVAETPVTI